MDNSNLPKRQFKVRSISTNNPSQLKQNYKPISQDDLKKINKLSEIKKPSNQISGTVGNSKAATNQQPPSKINWGIQRDLYKQRRQLENLRLQEDSQNTRLMKIQREERKVNVDYENQKKKMEKDLEDLAEKAADHNKRQQIMNDNLESVEKQTISNYDEKIKKNREQIEKDRIKNLQLEQEIQQVQQQIEEYQANIKAQQKEIKKGKIYESFLLEVKEEFKQDEYSVGAETVINKFSQLKTVQGSLTEKISKIEKKVKEKTKQISELKINIDQLNLKSTSDMNKIKLEIEEIELENNALDFELQGKEKQRLEQQIEQAQTVMAIDNIYSEYQNLNILLKEKKQKEEEENLQNINTKLQERKNKTKNEEEENQNETTKDYLRMINWINYKIVHLQNVDTHYQQLVKEKNQHKQQQSLAQ